MRYRDLRIAQGASVNQLKAVRLIDARERSWTFSGLPLPAAETISKKL